MNKMIYWLLGIIVAFALALGGFTKAEATPAKPVGTSKPVYVYYYLWWSSNHWRNKLGPNYPYSALRLPLPARTDLNGCHAVNKYAGNQLLDVGGKLFNQ